MRLKHASQPTSTLTLKDSWMHLLIEAYKDDVISKQELGTMLVDLLNLEQHKCF